MLLSHLYVTVDISEAQRNKVLTPKYDCRFILENFENPRSPRTKPRMFTVSSQNAYHRYDSFFGQSCWLLVT